MRSAVWTPGLVAGTLEEFTVTGDHVDQLLAQIEPGLVAVKRYLCSRQIAAEVTVVTTNNSRPNGGGTG